MWSIRHNTKKLRLWLVTFCMAMCTVPQFAQRYPILPVSDSPKQILTLFEDSHWRMWLGTKHGLYLFDGSRFYSMTEVGFPDMWVIGVAEDGDGGIWVTTRNGTPSVNAARGAHVDGGLYRLYRGHVEQLMDSSTLRVERAANNVMLVTKTTDHQFEYNDLYAFRKAGNAWKPQLILQHEAGRMRTDHSGNVLFPCPAGWCEFSKEQIRQWPLAGVHPTAHAVENNGHALQAVLRDRFGCVWALNDSEVFTGCAGDGELKRFDAWDGPSGYTLDEGPDGRVLAIHGSALAYGRPNAFSQARFENNLPDGMTTALAAHDGTIWLGTDSGGLYRFAYPFQLEYWNENDGINGALSLARVQGRMLAGNDGIFELDNTRRRWSLIPGTQTLHAVDAILPEPDGTFYAAGFGPAISHVTLSGRILARSTIDAFGMSLARDGDGQLWLGGSKGVSRVQARRNELELVPEVNTGQGTVLRYDPSRKTLWSYSYETILSHTDGQGKNGKWRRIDQADQLPDLLGVDLAIDSNGDLWTAFLNAARYGWIANPLRKPGEPFKIRIFNLGGGFIKPPVNVIEVDRNGLIWRGTATSSVYVADSEEARNGSWLELQAADGLPGQGVARFSFFSDLDGSIWYDTGKSIIHFHPPEDFVTRLPSPRIFLSGYSAGARKVQYSEALRGLPHGEDLVAHIGSLQFDRRNAFQFRWRLLPEQSAWQSGSSFDLPLDKPRWGSHALQVQARMAIGSNASPWSNIEEQTFIVLKPLWLTWFALDSYALCLGTLIFGGFHWRKKRKEQERKLLPELADWRLEALSPELHHLKGKLLDGRFYTGDLIARGGFANILEGRDMQHDGRLCAIKIFRNELLDKDWLEKRFYQEVAALERPDHPNVVHIYGSGRLESGAFYLVMEFISGQTLRSHLEAGPLDQYLVAGYLRQVGKALAAIHALGICHRDLKPENLMIRDDGFPDCELVLIDFSIAIVQDPDETIHGLSRAAGTFFYMAPEQAIGYANSSTDIYSLAKILVEMLAGQKLSVLLPDAAMDLPLRVQELLRSLPVFLSGESIEIISEALEFDPARRPSDAYAFASRIAEDLEKQHDDFQP